MNVATNVHYPMIWQSLSTPGTLLSIPDGIVCDSTPVFTPAGRVFATCTSGTSTPSALVTWASPTSQAVALPTPSGYSVKYKATLFVLSNGTLIAPMDGTSSGGGAIVRYYVWSGPNYTSPVPIAVPGDPTTTFTIIGSASPSGALYGSYYDGSSTHAAMWTSPTAAATTLPVPADAEFSGASVASSNGAILGVVQTTNPTVAHSAVWASPTSQPVYLQEPANINVFDPFGFDPTDASRVLGIVQFDTQGRQVVVWDSPTAAPTTLGLAGGAVSLVDFVTVGSNGALAAATADINHHRVLQYWSSASSAARVLAPPAGATVANLAFVPSSPLLIQASDGTGNTYVYTITP